MSVSDTPLATSYTTVITFLFYYLLNKVSACRVNSIVIQKIINFKRRRFCETLQRTTLSVLYFRRRNVLTVSIDTLILKIVGESTRRMDMYIDDNLQPLDYVSNLGHTHACMHVF